MIIYKIIIGLAITTLLNFMNRDILKDITKLKDYYKTVGFMMYIVVTVQIIVFYNPNNPKIIDFVLDKNLWFLSTLNYIALIDYQKKEIPNKLIIQQLFGLVILYILQILAGHIFSFSDLTTLAFTLLLTGGSFFIVYIITKGSLGAGDVKLMFVLGLSLTQNVAVAAMIYSLFLCTVSGLLMILLKKKKAKDTLPLAPFTLLATVIALLQFK